MQVGEVVKGTAGGATKDRHRIPPAVQAGFDDLAIIYLTDAVPRAQPMRQVGVEVTPAMIDARVAALFDELLEECVSWRTPGVANAVY